MKIVVIESEESEGGRLGVIVPEKALWAFEVLCARAGQKILKEVDEDACQPVRS